MARPSVGVPAVSVPPRERGLVLPSQQGLGRWAGAERGQDAAQLRSSERREGEVATIY